MSNNSPFPTISEVRDYWNRRPCNLRHSNAAIGTRQYFDEVERRKYFVEPHIPEFAQFHRWKGKRVLEVGCGIGTDAVNFARSGAEYTGVELSQESLQLTRKRFEVYGLEGELIEGNAEELDSVLSGRTFDLVYSFGVLHHTPNPQKAFAILSRLMSAESELRVMLYAKRSWKAAMIEAELDQPEAQSGCPVAYCYTREEIEDMLEGLEILECRQDHIFPFNVEQYKQYKYVKEPWFEAMPVEVFRALERSLGWHTLVVAKLPVR